MPQLSQIFFAAAVLAADADPNSQPNPYRTIEHWAKLRTAEPWDPPARWISIKMAKASG